MKFHVRVSATILGAQIFATIPVTADTEEDAIKKAFKHLRSEWTLVDVEKISEMK